MKLFSKDIDALRQEDHPQGINGMTLTYKTGQYELKQLVIGRYGQIEISSIHGFGIQQYFRPYIVSPIIDWYERKKMLSFLRLGEKKHEGL